MIAGLEKIHSGKISLSVFENFLAYLFFAAKLEIP